MYADWAGHVVVCGLHGLGLRIVEQLRQAGERVVVVDDDPELRLARIVTGWGVPHVSGCATFAETLTEAGLAGAAAIVCVERTDLQNLEIALLARELRPDVRVVAHVSNAAVGRAVAESGTESVLDVAALAAPSIVEACARRAHHDLDLDGAPFRAVGVRAPRDGTLRELYGDLAPIAVTGAGGETAVCPGRDLPVARGDRVTLVGTPREFDDRQIPCEGPAPAATAPRTGFRPLVRPVFDDAARGLRRGLAALGLVIALSTAVLRIGYQEPGMSVLDALYFSIETIATVGFGDFSFADQPVWLRLYATGLMVVGVTCTAITFAYLTDLLVSRRLARTSGRRQVERMTGHVIVVGLGRVGVRVMGELLAQGRQAVVVERDDDNPYLAQARSLGVPVIFGDATVAATLADAGLAQAAAVAVVTSDDMVNIETGLAVRDLLGERWSKVPVVLRVFDRTLARTVALRFGFAHVRSTAELAAPWFVGAALGLHVLGTFTAHARHFLLGRFTVTPGSALDGAALSALPEGCRVVAISSGGGLDHPPRRGTRLRAGDEAYALGPYEELLHVLRRGRTPVG